MLCFIVENHKNVSLAFIQTTQRKYTKSQQFELEIINIGDIQFYSSLQIFGVIMDKRIRTCLDFGQINDKQATSQYVMPLRTIQKSKERPEPAHLNKKPSQSYVQTTQSTYPNFYKPDSARKVNTTSSQIQQLQRKVNNLFKQYRAQTEMTPKRTSKCNNSRTMQNHSRSRQQSSGSKKNERTRHKASSILERIEVPDFERGREDSSISMLKLKIAALKMLSQLQAREQSQLFIEQSENLEQLFQSLLHIISKHVRVQTAQAEKQAKNLMQKHMKDERQQIDKLKSQIKNQLAIIVQLQQERILLKEKIARLNTEVEMHEEENHRTKIMYQRAQSDLLKLGLDHNCDLEAVRREAWSQAWSEIKRQTISLQLKNSPVEHLKSHLSNKSTANYQLKLGLLSLLHNYEIYINNLAHCNKLENPQDIATQQHRQHFMSICQQMKHQSCNLHLGFIDSLFERLNQAMHQNELLSKQARELHRVKMEAEKKAVEAENEYLFLNNDYAKNVKLWVMKEDDYEHQIAGLRDKLIQAQQVIGEQSQYITKFDAD